MVEALTLTKNSLFWVIFRAHRHSHFNSALCFHQPPPLSLKHKTKHSTPLCHLLWPGDSPPSYKAGQAQSHFLITAQLLPNPALLSAAFQAGRNACLLTTKASQLGSSTAQFQVQKKQTLFLSLPSYTSWQQRKCKKQTKDAVW